MHNQLNTSKRNRIHLTHQCVFGGFLRFVCFMWTYSAAPCNRRPSCFLPPRSKDTVSWPKRGSPAESQHMFLRRCERYNSGGTKKRVPQYFDEFTDPKKEMVIIRYPMSHWVWHNQQGEIQQTSKCISSLSDDVWTRHWKVTNPKTTSHRYPSVDKGILWRDCGCFDHQII